MQKIVNSNAYELVGDGKEREFNERVDSSKPEIIAIVETKLIEDVDPHVAFHSKKRGRRHMSRKNTLSD